MCPSPPCFSFTPDTPCTTTTRATDPEEEGILGGAPGELAHGGAVPRTYSPLASSSQISKKTIRSYLHWQGPALGRVMVLSLVAGTAAGGKEDLKSRQVAAPGVWSPTHSSKQGKAEQALGRSWGQTGRATKQGSSKAGDSAGGTHTSPGGHSPILGTSLAAVCFLPLPKQSSESSGWGFPRRHPAQPCSPRRCRDRTQTTQHRSSTRGAACGQPERGGRHISLGARAGCGQASQQTTALSRTRATRVSAARGRGDSPSPCKGGFGSSGHCVPQGMAAAGDPRSRWPCRSPVRARTRLLRLPDCTVRGGQGRRAGGLLRAVPQEGGGGGDSCQHVPGERVQERARQSSWHRAAAEPEGFGVLLWVGREGDKRRGRHKAKRLHTDTWHEGGGPRGCREHRGKSTCKGVCASCTWSERVLKGLWVLCPSGPALQAHGKRAQGAGRSRGPGLQPGDCRRGAGRGLLPGLESGITRGKWRRDGLSGLQREQARMKAPAAGTGFGGPKSGPGLPSSAPL